MSEKGKILLVEDEEHIGRGIVFNLEQENYHVKWVDTGEHGLETWKSWRPHAIILDIMLPMMSGLEVLSAIRQVDEEIPILILSAKDQDKDKIKGLKLGCDDYLAKPFNLEELLLRTENMLKRSLSMVENTFYLGEWSIDRERYLAKGKAGEFNLTLQELKIIELLVSNKGKAVTREQLLIDALGYSDGIESRTIDNFIVRLRRYFEIDPKEPLLIKSVRGVGYRYDERPY